MPFPVDLGSYPVATTIGSAPASESWPGIVIEYNPAPAIVTAANPFPLSRISKEQDCVLGDGRQRCAYRRTMPMDGSGGGAEFPHKPGLAGYPIEHTDVGGRGNLAINDGNRDSPYSAAEPFGDIQIFGPDPYVRKMKRAE